jgi:glucosamine--fructose-6-phosphate aminotransferase (isomerizing)
MCGIVGYIGERQAQPLLLQGLKRLEYRGYDSSGMCVIVQNKNELLVRKLPGKVRELENILLKKKLSGTVGISHNRWATHGAPNQTNAHPHLDCRSEIALVHNGIIENFAALKQALIRQGHKFKSETDTEVIVHLIEKFYRNEPLEMAVRKALGQLEGSFSIALICAKEPNKLIASRRGSPLVIGVGRNENFIASDIPALLDFAKDVIFLDDDQMAVLTKNDVKISRLTGETVKKQPKKINWDITQAQKGGWPHFMIKEINEQPAVLEKIFSQRVKNDRIDFANEEVSARLLSSIKNIVIIACGTAYHAGMCGKYIIEGLSLIPVATELSSEFRYRSPLIGANTLAIAISQSGETADTLAAVKEAKKRGAQVLAICNVLGSSLVRESDGVLYTHAGPEIGVASTKAYTAQLGVLYLLGLYFAQERKTIPPEKLRGLIRSLLATPLLQKKTLKSLSSIKEIAKRHSHFGSFLFLGRNINYPMALEGALKLKEISYIPAEGYAAGEMKHGPIALIDEYRAVVCIAIGSPTYEKMISNIQEIHSRRGKLIAIATDGDKKILSLTDEVIYLPRVEELFSPLIVALPLQLLAYYIAAKRGCDVDQPRNLAKSVTVE